MVLKGFCAFLVVAGTFLLSRSLFTQRFQMLINIRYHTLPWYLRILVFGYKRKYETMELWSGEEGRFPTSAEGFPFDMKLRIIEPFLGFMLIVSGTLGALFI